MILSCHRARKNTNMMRTLLYIQGCIIDAHTYILSQSPPKKTRNAKKKTRNAKKRPEMQKKDPKCTHWRNIIAVMIQVHGIGWRGPDSWAHQARKKPWFDRNNTVCSKSFFKLTYCQWRLRASCCKVSIIFVHMCLHTIMCLHTLMYVCIHVCGYVLRLAKRMSIAKWLSTGLNQ